MADANPQVPPGYRLELFDEQDAVTHEDVIAMWERDGVLGPEVSGRRVQEVLFVAITADGEAASVNTVSLERDPRLALSLWFLRSYTARDHRMRNLGLALALLAIDHMHQEHAAGRETRGAGMGHEIENVGLRVHGDATGYPLGATFVGVNHRGNPLWVRYFPGARAPGPPA